MSKKKKKPLSPAKVLGYSLAAAATVSGIAGILRMAASAQYPQPDASVAALVERIENALEAAGFSADDIVEVSSAFDGFLPKPRAWGRAENSSQGYAVAWGSRDGGDIKVETFETEESMLDFLGKLR